MRRPLPLRILCIWISCLLLAGNLCNAPMPPRVKKGSYPCEGHGCGCKSAEDCRKHCCCHYHEHRTTLTHSDGASNLFISSKYSFLRGLACMGYPHKFSSFQNLIFVSQEVPILPVEMPQRFVREGIPPEPIQGSVTPLERPPRPLAQVGVPKARG